MRPRWTGSSRPRARISFFFFQAEDGIRDYKVTGVQTCALPIYQNLRDLEPLLPRVGLRHEQVVHIYAKLLGVLDVERVLGVDVGGGPAGALGVPHHVERQCGLAARLGTEDLGHPAARDAPDADRGV